MVVFGKSGCIRAKLVVFGQIVCIWSIVVVVHKVVVLRQKWYHSGKVVVFG